MDLQDKVNAIKAILQEFYNDKSCDYDCYGCCSACDKLSKIDDILEEAVSG